MQRNAQNPCKNGHGAPRDRQGRCIECRRLASVQWRAAHPERVRNLNRKYRSANRAKVRERDRLRERRRKGLPQPTRPEPQICECCGRPSPIALNLDHDHATGKFRGWLCRKCNAAIGALGDTVDSLARALDYVWRNT